MAGHVILSVALSPSVDTTYVVESLREGESARPLSTHPVAGGKAINMARAAAFAGAPVSVLAPLGGASGQFIAQALADAGIPLIAIPQREETRRCVSVFSQSTGLLTEIYERMRPLDEDGAQRIRAAFELALEDRPDWVSFSGSMPDSLSVDFLHDLVAAAIAAGCSVAIDSHGPGLARALDARPTLVKVNRAEAAELLGLPIETALEQLVSAISARTGNSAVVTDGRDGSLGASREGQTYHVTFDGRAGGFAVGSGDCYLGGMLASLDEGATIAEALLRGTTLAIANTLAPGAAVIPRDELATVAAHVRLRELGRLAHPSVG
jgi:1-phosphofructokinase family hexose kinase